MVHPDAWPHLNHKALQGHSCQRTVYRVLCNAPGDSFDLHLLDESLMSHDFEVHAWT